MLDHATGVRIGESAVVGAGVSMLHRVTLGGAGPAAGGRHPTVGDGVLLGAGVSVLGAVTVGAGAKVGAGSVVLTDLPPNCTAVGVPARVVGFAKPKPRAAQLAAAGGAEGPGGGGGRAGEEGGGGGDGGGAPGLAIPECDMDQCAALNAVMDWTI